MAWVVVLLVALLALGTVPVGRPLAVAPTPPGPAVLTTPEAPQPASGPQESGVNTPFQWQTLNSTPQLPNNTLWSADYDPGLGKIVALSEGQFATTQVTPYGPSWINSSIVQNCSFSQTNSTWAFSGGHWTQLHVAGPSPGLYRSVAYDPSMGALVEFQATGGLLPNTSTSLICGLDRETRIGYFPAPGMLAPSTNSFSGLLPSQHPETWEFMGGNWTRLPIQNPLNAITNIVYDPALSALVMFTTINNVSNKLDLWELDGGNWINRGATEIPSAATTYGMYFNYPLNFSNAGADSWQFNPNCAWNWSWIFNGSSCTPNIALYLNNPDDQSNLIYDPQLGELLWFIGQAQVLAFNGSWSLISRSLLTANGFYLTDPAYDPAVSGLVGELCLDPVWYSINYGYNHTSPAYCWNDTGVYSNGSLESLNATPPPPLYYYTTSREINFTTFFGSWQSPVNSAILVFDPRDGYLVMFGAGITVVPHRTYYSPDTTYIFGPTAQLQLSVSVAPTTVCSQLSNACGSAQSSAQVTVSVTLLPTNATAPLPNPRAGFAAYGPLYWVPAPQLSYLPAPQIHLLPSVDVSSSCFNLTGPVSPCPAAPRVESTGSGPPLYLWDWGNGSEALQVGSTWTVTFTIASTLAANATIPIDRCAPQLCGPADSILQGFESGLASRASSGVGTLPYSWPITEVDVLDPVTSGSPPNPTPGPTPTPPSPPPAPLPTSPISLPTPTTLLPTLIGSVAPGLSYLALAAGVIAAGFTRGRLRHPTPQRALAMALKRGTAEPRRSPRD